MQAAQVLKSHREAVEHFEKKKEEGHYGGEDGEEHEGSDLEENEILVEVPKYLQGIPLVDSHTENTGEV